MTKAVKGARFLLKRSTSSGVVPTIPTSDDHTTGWLTTDIYIGELFTNVADNRVWVRSNNAKAAIEFAMLDSTTSRLPNSIMPTTVSCQSILLANGSSYGVTFDSSATIDNTIYQTSAGVLTIGNAASSIQISANAAITSTGTVTLTGSTVTLTGQIKLTSNITVSAAGVAALYAGVATSSTAYTAGVTIGGLGFYGTTTNLNIIYNNAIRHRFDSSGNIYAMGTILGGQSSFSDKRLKKDIVAIENANEIISNLNMVSYSYVYDDKSKKHFGMIAQDLEEILPNLVDEYETPFYDGKSYKAINYTELIPYSLAANKENYKSIVELREEIRLLREEIKSLK